MTDAPPRLRLYVEASLADGALVTLDPRQAHYVLHVMRLRPGDTVLLFNGQDGEWQARLDPADKKSSVFTLLSRLRPQPPAGDLWLLFAAVKRARIDLIVEKATELGVAVLQPVTTARSQSQRIGDERLRLIAIEAAEQCGRLTLPEIRPLTVLTSALQSWPSGRRLLLLDETGAGQPIATVLSGLTPAPTALLVGPEGGFTKSELDAVGRLAFATRVGMGHRILRADTAVTAALACYQAWCGDWREPSP